jgi:hypothetical protein
MAMGGSNMQNACKCCATHPRQQSTNVDSLGRSGLVQLLRLAAKKHNNTTMMKKHRQSNVDGGGNDGDGRDSSDDGNGDGNGDNAVTTADGDNVYDDNSGILRMAIGRQRLDNDNGRTTM